VKGEKVRGTFARLTENFSEPSNGKNPVSGQRRHDDDPDDKALALGTLRHIMKTLALVMAPSMPFYAEYLWGRVKNADDAESVHLASWPAKEHTDTEVLEEMKMTRDIVSLALESRAKANIKARQPLGELKVKSSKLKEEFTMLIKDEVNVKNVIFDESIAENVELDLTITPELKREGDVREFMRQVQDMRKKAGLEPSDRIILTVETSEEGEKLLGEFGNEIVKTVGADSVLYSQNDGEKVAIGDNSFTITLSKI
jgi:isoleucyl-tRNA synthetase